MAQVAERAEDLGAYLQSAQADQMLEDLERFARRRPWVTAGVGVLRRIRRLTLREGSADRRYESLAEQWRWPCPADAAEPPVRRCVDDER